MGNVIQIIDNIDNSNTLYEDVLINLYGDDAGFILMNTKILRTSILKIIKDFIDKEKTICIKEFSTAPIMTYVVSDEYNQELRTDLVIIPEAYNLSVINDVVNNMNTKVPLVLEALHPKQVAKESWDDYLDEIALFYLDADVEVHKIVIEDVVKLLSNWDDSDNQEQKEMIKTYIVEHNIGYNSSTYWQEPLYLIAKKYWDKFSFVLTINDYEIYDDSVSKYLDVIAEKYFDNGYFDEIVIKMNYFYWYDDFQKIIDWTERNLRSALVSYRFDTIFSNTSKNRYFNEVEASKYNDTLRQNTIQEELEMFETRLPVLLEKILTNPQTYGFELQGGYFGAEGFIPNLDLGSDEFEEYKQMICKILNMSPFSSKNDVIARVFRDPEKRMFFCVKSSK